MTKTENDSILVFKPMASPQENREKETLGIAKVPLGALKTNMEVVLKEAEEIFSEIKERLGHCKVEHIDLSLGIAVDGSIGILGTGASGEAKGGITVRMKFE